MTHIVILPKELTQEYFCREKNSKPNYKVEYIIVSKPVKKITLKANTSEKGSIVEKGK